MLSSCHPNKAYGKVDAGVDLKNQTIDMEGGRIVSSLSDGKLLPRLYPDATTLYESFRRGCAESNNGDCLGYRKRTSDGTSPYHWIRYEEAIRRAENLAQGFLEKGLAIGQETFVGIYCANRPEWILTEQACYVYSMVTVPLYDTLGLDSCSFILRQTEIKVVVADQSKNVEKLLSKHGEFPTLRLIVLIERAEQSLLNLAKSCDVEIAQFDAIELLGGTAIQKTPPKPPSPKDWSTICYTSGTTGVPKGAILTHFNVIADCTVIATLKNSQPTPEDTMISYLPLAHMFERFMEHFIFITGGRVGYFGGDVKLIMDDLQELKPTIVPIVPRLMNRIYDGFTQVINRTRIKRHMVAWAVSSKLKGLKKSVIRTDSMPDKLVFNKVRSRFGGRVRLMITGSAPCSTEILTFMRLALGCVVLEGYGQTECVAAATVSVPGDHVPGHVGVPIPCCSIKLVDVPEMSYWSKEGRGEVCIKGHNVFQGYYKDGEKTRQVLDDDSWLHTGDIGHWTTEGTLKLIDRKKHIFKLSQGEYVAPEKIEAVYARNQYIAQCFIYGESLKSCVIGVVVPDLTTLLPYAQKFGHSDSDSLADVCKNEKVKTFVLSQMIAEGQRAGLASFEQVKDVHLSPDLFSVENGMLTPTFKSKRLDLKECFKENLAEMYSKLA